MAISITQTTAPAAADTADQAVSLPRLVLVIVWSASQPHRVGEVAFFPAFEERFVGRGDNEVEKFAHFGPHRPGDTPVIDPREGLLTGDSMSRRQARIRATAVALEMERIGRSAMLVNGQERDRATLKPGDTVMIKGELLLLCTRRPRTLLAPAGLGELHALGEPDAWGMVGDSAAAWNLRCEIARVAGTDDHVLVQGESGTGKELVASALHQASTRAKNPFVAHNASTFTPNLVASELFGNPANYPNAGMPARTGVFGAAHHGTLFLDEIGDLPPDVQVQLLRALQSGEYKPVGESTPRRADVRVVGATNKDDSSFRLDFLPRFLGRIRVPPLRERQEDIPLLIRHWFLQRAQKFSELARFMQTGPSARPELRISGRLVDVLVRHPLPLNVRELHGLLLKAVAASPGDVVRLPSSGPTTVPPVASPSSVPEEVNGYVPPGSPSKAELLACLDRERGSISRVARVLGVHRNAVYRLMASYGIKKDGIV
jgi:DNA-binding NtrC family response regulator